MQETSIDFLPEIEIKKKKKSPVKKNSKKKQKQNKPQNLQVTLMSNNLILESTW